MNTTTPTILNHEALTMSSREIAKLCGKRHDHVMADIRNMLTELKIQSPDFSGDYTDSKGRVYSCFNLPKRETLILVSGYRLELRAKIIDRWQELENQQAQPRPSNKDERAPLRQAVTTLVGMDNNLDYRDVYRMVHQRFGVDEVEALTREQIPQAIAYVHELTVKAATGKGPLHGLLQEDKGKVAAIALMHTGWLRFAEHQNALEAIRRQVVGILDTLDAILTGSGAVYDGLYEAQARLGLGSHILREGHALAERRYRPRITA